MSMPHPPLAETEKLAAQMLAQPNPVAQLSLAEAMVVVDMMRPKRVERPPNPAPAVGRGHVSREASIVQPCA